MMTKSYGRSYCVPLWHYDDDSCRCIYTQHGERWSPSGVYDAWEIYGKFLDTIWVRWHDSGDDFDKIFQICAKRKKHLCEYGVDEIRISGEEDLSHELDAQWQSKQQGVWVTSVQGRYFAGNERTDRGGDILIQGPTTIRGGHQMLKCNPGFETRSLMWKTDQKPPVVVKIEPWIFSHATKIEFLWRGRVTRIYQQHKECWWEWCLDDWDNCLDHEWLAEDPAWLAEGHTHLFGRLRQNMMLNSAPS
jgi:hypothetical protein